VAELKENEAEELQKLHEIFLAKKQEVHEQEKQVTQTANLSLIGR
jgi:hypothetical protein